MSERSPLLTQNAEHTKTKRRFAVSLVVLFAILLVTFVVLGSGLPTDPDSAAIAILQRSPVIVSIHLLLELPSTCTFRTVILVRLTLCTTLLVVSDVRRSPRTVHERGVGGMQRSTSAGL